MGIVDAFQEDFLERFDLIMTNRITTSANTAAGTPIYM